LFTDEEKKKKKKYSSKPKNSEWIVQSSSLVTPYLFYFSIQ